MSVTVETRVIEPGSAEFADQAWELKERIRQAEGVLKQRRSFFMDAYRRATVYATVARTNGERLVAFAACRRDGYILFLAVHPDFRGQNFGRRLVRRVADEHSSVSCHARTTNQNALEFYEHLGFEIKRRIDHYYEDGGSAYYLRLTDREGLTERLSKFVGR